MAGASIADNLRSILSSINPRRSLDRLRDVADYRFSREFYPSFSELRLLRTLELLGFVREFASFLGA